MTDAKIKYRLKGHESFTLREGWLTKGIMAVHRKPDLFSENFGADELGVGTNMAKSIRYWLKCSGLTEEKTKGEVALTGLGECLLKEDAYFEDEFSLWLLHANIVRNFEQATSWYLFFNEYEQETFSRKEMVQEMRERLMARLGLNEITERSLSDDCDAILHMYSGGAAHEVNPEEKRYSPFYRLGLLREQDGVYQREQPDLKKMDAMVVLYVMQYILEPEKEFYCISVEKLLRAENSPGRILQLRRSFLMQYLEELEQKGYLWLNRTAGLDMVYQKRIVTTDEILENYFGGK